MAPPQGGDDRTLAEKRQTQAGRDSEIRLMELIERGVESALEKRMPEYFERFGLRIETGDERGEQRKDFAFLREFRLAKQVTGATIKAGLLGLLFGTAGLQALLWVLENWSRLTGGH